MLDPNYLEHITNSLMQSYIDKAILSIVKDAARRIVKTGTITATAEWQIARLAELGAYHDFVLSELSKATQTSQSDLLNLFDDAAKRTLETDDKIYRAVGYEPILLKDNPFMQNIIWSAQKRTQGTFFNLTSTTANTATRQFETILDKGHMRLSSGAFSYQEVIKWGVKELSSKGIASIYYPTGHVDYADVAYRRATLTGLNQAALAVQERRTEEMGTEYVETTVHAGARPSHAEWQGKVFKLHGSEKGYPNFYEATGYGTGAGLGGWNCRHGYYPFFPGISELANTREYLNKLNNATVNFNGKEISLYDATQIQRKNERMIRKWKREKEGMEAAGLDSSYAQGKISNWQEAQRDFVRQTDLPRDYFRERAGRQNSI